ncbi:MAG TPA: hypothetical protein VMB84_14525 [Stellaceae bacterium]|nr:hypothetical protein [Stellaceae bacterium]
MTARAALLGALALLAGCAQPVAMRDPRGGGTAVCAQSLDGLDPWSQTYACAAAYAEQGWVEQRNPP